MKQEIYNSSTLGPIPLSFTGRRLMQNLREAFVKAIEHLNINGRMNWEPVSLARGELAQYMSKLEQRQLVAETQTVEAVSAPANKTSVYHLPPIPPGYVLSMIGGNMLVIKPESVPNSPNTTSNQREFTEGELQPFFKRVSEAAKYGTPDIDRCWEMFKKERGIS